jgi:hypothetical protein
MRARAAVNPSLTIAAIALRTAAHIHHGPDAGLAAMTTSAAATQREDRLPSSIQAFVDGHLGPDCQLSLRLN